jgi:hypothetical protein
MNFGHAIWVSLSQQGETTYTNTSSLAHHFKGHCIEGFPFNVYVHAHMLIFLNTFMHIVN